ncbi:MAG: lipopolysaccharide heptosyltransferase II [Elusimicrobia bacterium]|nr:lipopolysaccharide heptosyltransferase II [Elusimicrobiota bacterium]
MEQPKILVLRLSSLGDVVLTAPVYRNLKAHWPQAEVTVMVKPQFAAVLAGNPCVDRVLPYRGFLSALRAVRDGGFTHLLDLHGTGRTVLLRRLSGVPVQAAYRKHALARRLYVLFRWSSPALSKHTLERYLEALVQWGVPVVHRELRLGDYGSDKAHRPAAQPSRVLIMQTSFLGDALLTVPLARRVKEVMPGARLSVLTRPDTAAVFKGCSAVDEVLLDDKHGAHRGLRGLLAAGRALRAGGFDLALVPHRSLRTALVAWLSGIPRRIGFAASSGAPLFHETVAFPWGAPEAERNLALLLPLAPGIKAEPGDSLYLAKDGGVPEALKERLRSAGVADADVLVGIHPGSVWPTKRWLPERFAALAGRLSREAGAKVILLGGPGDKALSAGVAAGAGVPVLDWTGQTTLPELIALTARLNLLVTNDSGPMHVAAAHGVPVLALFGPTTKELGFFPYGQGHRVLEADLNCRPCGLHGSRACPEGHFLCMRLITVEAAFQAARELLGTGTEAAA